MTPSTRRNIVKPKEWLRYQYPFLYGQFDPSLFPTNDWRECARGALSVLEIHNWARDLVDGDDPELIDQLRLHVLPRRGIWASPDEIIVTIGAQQALYLLAQLLLGKNTTIGVEDPGYPDARNIFSTMSDRVIGLPVDEDGLQMSSALNGCDYVYLTPGHQCPTTVTMPLERRSELLSLARENDFVIIEDDYETEFLPDARETPSLKSLDVDGRVLYVGSLSKVLAPGLRLGYIIAPAPVIHELRALRRLMLRHLPRTTSAQPRYFSVSVITRRISGAWGRLWAPAPGFSIRPCKSIFRGSPGSWGTAYRVAGCVAPRDLTAMRLRQRPNNAACSSNQVISSS